MSLGLGSDRDPIKRHPQDLETKCKEIWHAYNPGEKMIIIIGDMKGKDGC
jgi:hypothetical protein